MSNPQFSESSFWEKVEKVAQLAVKIAKEVLEKAFVLYYAAMDEATPEWARVTSFAALAYFIMPIDVIPDYIPAIGFSDDLSVLAGAILTIAMQIQRKHRKQADEKMEELFGPVDENDDQDLPPDSEEPLRMPKKDVEEEKNESYR